MKNTSHKVSAENGIFPTIFLKLYRSFRITMVFYTLMTMVDISEKSYRRHAQTGLLKKGEITTQSAPND